MDKERSIRAWVAVGLLACAALLAPHAVAADYDWQVGLASVVITPEEPVPLSGYASREGNFTGVVHDLHAKAMALEDGEGNRALLITSDVIGYPGPLAERICARVTEATGVPREAILLSASHTHAGPSMRSNSSIGAQQGADDTLERYLDGLVEKIATMSEAAVKDKSPATLAWGQGIENFVMNRREFTERGIRLGVNPRGPVDRTVPVMRIAGEDGALRGVLFGAACHCTTLTGEHTEICGDYAGFAQYAVEEALPGVQAMFITGCAGDSNPYERGTLDLARAHGATLAAEVMRVLDTELAPLSGPLTTAFSRTELPLQRFDSKADLDRMSEKERAYKSYFLDAAERRFDEGGTLPATYSAPFAVWQFGEDLTLVGFSGEVVVDYVYFTERDLGPLKLWISAYCNDVYGYLPSARVLEEGGYETRGLYTDVGLFAPQTETVVMETIRRLAREAGRPMPE